MAKLAEFLKTGALGPLVPGIDPFSAIESLGEPDAESTKKNPLVLKYGSLQLVFWKNGHKSQLRDITLSFMPAFEPIPDIVKIDDFTVSNRPTLKYFRNFMFEIKYPPAHILEGENSWTYTFLSGVMANFSNNFLDNIKYTHKRNNSSSHSPLSDAREPSLHEIHDMIHESAMISRMGAHRPALVVAWAALEAVLRRKAIRLGKKGQIGVQPTALMTELVSLGVLSRPDRQFLEEVRQVRTSVVHGLAPVEFLPTIVDDINRISLRLLAGEPES